MRRILFAFLLIGHLQLVAQNVSRPAALEDLVFLAEGIKQYNPALSKYNPAFDSLSNQVIDSVTDDSISVFAFFSKVSTICALANEGHFSVGDREDIVYQLILGDTYAYLPITVKIFSG
ncbi:MAG: hypothetical protein AAFU67_06010, partial [Bacteroidota bacterium]